MTTDDLRTEFRQLANTLQPLNARRKLINDELKKRLKSAAAKLRIRSLERGEKVVLYLELKQDLGR